MKTNPFIVSLIFGVLCFSIYANIKQLMASRADAQRIESLNESTKNQSGIISKYIDKDSSTHVIYKSVFVKSDAEKELVAGRTYMDSLKKALNIKTGQILEFTRVKATVAAIVKTKVKKDTAGNTEFSYNGKWLNFLVKSKDSSAKYNYNIELRQLKRTEGNFLTGHKVFRDISFADPNAKIKGVSSFTIPPEPTKRLGFGLQAGYYYDPSQNRFLPAFGVGLSYNLIQIF